MGRTKAGFELRDHTADIALFLWADSLEGLFRAGAEGLYATIGVLRLTPTDRNTSLRLEAEDSETLLHDFLAELHYRFDAKGERLNGFAFGQLDDRVLEATATVAEVDLEASILDREVKAVTYHDLSIAGRDGGYEVTIILDI